MKAPVTVVEPGTVRLERLLPGPLERVWAYVTESDKRARWFAAGEWDLRVGGRIRLDFDNAGLARGEAAPQKYKDKERASFGGVITRLEPMRLLAHTWTWESGDTEVTYELTPKGKDVLLVIVHGRVPAQAGTAVMSGWDVHSGILADILNGVEPRALWSEIARAEKQYAAAL
jgi:uncharacterized protein YndB with AHSA1/START domain